MRGKVLVLAICMLFTGTINTITTKFQDLAIVGHRPDGSPIAFQHPAVQSACMFFGEMLCLLPFFIHEWRLRDTTKRVKRRQELQRKGRAFQVQRVLVFGIPAMCDAVGTTLLNVGLYYTYASTYQMLRGTLVLFAGFFTVTVLRRRLYIHHWLGMVLITGGAALVGAASVIYSQKKGDEHGDEGALGAVDALVTQIGRGVEVLVAAPRRLLGHLYEPSGGEVIDGASAPLFGDLCVVAAQAFTALQFILEEKFVSTYRVPTLLAVGMEGAWGVLLCCVVLPVLNHVKDSEGRPIEDAAQAFRDIASHGPLLGSVALSIVSIAFFNFFGISVTKALSGAARATIDACRTLFIWLVSLYLGWEKFLPLEVVGFIVLFSGTSLYNELIRVCLPTVRPEDGQYTDLAGQGEEQGSGSGSGSESDDEGPSGRGVGKGDAEQGGPLAEPLLLHSPSKAVPTAPGPARVGSHRHSQAESDSDYTMARSMRLGASTLQPHSLDELSDGMPTNSFGASMDNAPILNARERIHEGDEDSESGLDAPVADLGGR